MFDVQLFRDDFPILKQKINDYPLIYLDNAASTQKPKIVIDRISHYYNNEHSNIHRGVHKLSEIATEAYESSRETVRKFINARKQEEIIFTRGTTESINLVANSFGDKYIKEKDEIIISAMEHHSNIVPWQILCEKKGALLKVIPMDKSGTLVIDKLEELITDRTKLISITYVSNAIGTVNPVKKIIEISHKNDVPVLLDCAQAISHIPIDVQALNPDFIAFSGHKIYGPTGIGVLYGKKELLNEMPPYQGGGDMILSVSFEKTTYNELPYKFEAGTPNIAGVIGLGAALNYVTGIGINSIKTYEDELLTYMKAEVSKVNNIQIIGNSENTSSVLSFLLGDIHPHDIGTILNQHGVAIRTGHHCAQPVMDFFNIPATARASISFYNNKSDIDQLVFALKKTLEVF